MIDKSLYGLKTSAARLLEALVDVLLKMKFKPSKEDSELWLKDFGSHHKYLVVYVDDLIIVGKAIVKNVHQTIGFLYVVLMSNNWI